VIVWNLVDEMERAFPDGERDDLMLSVRRCRKVKALCGDGSLFS
jgi:hypothetical protein